MVFFSVLNKVSCIIYAFEQFDGGRRRRLQKAHRSEKRQATCVPALTNRRVHRQPHRDGQTTQAGTEEETSRGRKTETGMYSIVLPL